MILLRRRRASSVIPILLVLALLYSCLPGLGAQASQPVADAQLGAPAAIRQGGRPSALGASPKPAWRVDAANSGRLATTGPATQPGQAFSAHPVVGSVAVVGVELDAAGNIIAADSSGGVYSYSPGGALNWTATLAAGTGSNILGNALTPTASADGALYVGADDGTLYQINPAALTGGQALSCPIFTAPLSGGVQPGITTIAQVDQAGDLLVGDDGGTFYAVAPPAPAAPCPAPVPAKWTFAAAGSTPSSGVSAGHPSVAPFSFFGEAALDTTGHLFVASTDSNSQQAGTPQTLGTLYSLSAATGAKNWAVPLLGRVQGAVVYDAATDAAIVADADGEVVAVQVGGAAAGAVLWRVHPAPTAGGGATRFIASPALSPDGQTVYVQDTNYLYALSAATGTLNTAFDPAPPPPPTGLDQNLPGTAFDGGSASSPIVDAAGNLFVEASTGALRAYSAAGAPVWTVAAGPGPGQSGSFSGQSGVSPAIGADHTVYIGGNKGFLRGFNIISPADQTATQIAFLTGTSTPTTTNTPTQTDTATNTAIPASTNTNTGTPTNTSTVVPGSTNTNTGTPTNSPTQTSTNSPTQTPTSTLTQTETSTPTPTRTATATVTTTGTQSPTVSPTPNWSRLRGDASNGGTNVNVKLDLSSAPGPVFPTPVKLGSGLADTPIVGPDSTIYEPDGTGHLVALKPDGSIKWTSDAVLGSLLPTGSPSAYFFDSGSSAAIGPDGYLYAGSEDHGIYRFDPATGKAVAHDGSASPFFGSGQYSGSSVTVGPDGAVYAGSTGQDGTFYAVNPDGTRRYSYTPGCKIGKPQFQGTAVLDAQSNVYVGYICVTGVSQPAGGGVIKLGPQGSRIWAFLPSKPKGTDDANGEPMYGAAVLSPDGQTVYTLDIGGSALYAIASDTGQPRWSFRVTTPRAVPALSPKGDLLYLGVTPAPPSDPEELYAINTTNGTVAKAITLSDSGADQNGVGYAAPAVDGAGQVLFGFASGRLQGYSAGLGQQLFSELINNQPGTAIIGGPVIATSGAIYLTTKKGYLVGLKAGVQVPPTSTPRPTSPPPATLPPPPTNTAVPPIPTDPPSATPKPGTGTPTVTPQGTRSAASTAVGTQTTIHIGNSPTPTPVATATAIGVKTVSANGFHATFNPGNLLDGDLALLTVQADKGGARFNYALKFSYTTTRKPITTVLKPTLPPAPRCAIAATVKGGNAVSFSRTADKRGKDVFCLRLTGVPKDAISLQISAVVDVSAGSLKYKRNTLVFPVTKLLPMRVTVSPGLLLPKGSGTISLAAAAGALVTYQLSYPGTKPQVMKHIVGAKGMDKISFKNTYTPSRHDGQVQVSISVTGVVQGIVKGNTATQFTVRRSDVVLVLTKLGVKVLTPKVRAKAAVQIDLIAARGAYIKYTITYGSQKAKYSYGLVPDGSGYATIHFPADYTPAKGKSIGAAVSITVTQGKKVLHAAAKFTIQG